MSIRRTSGPGQVQQLEKGMIKRKKANPTRGEAQRGRKNPPNSPGASTPLAQLLDGLRALSSEMYFGEWAGKADPEFPYHPVATRIRSLVATFQRHAAQGRLTVPEQADGWRQVVRCLALFRAIAPRAPTQDLPEDDRRTIDDVSRTRSYRKLKNAPSPVYNREKARQTRRYQLTVIDILADYIRFRCETVVGLHPPIRPVALLQECDRIVSSLFVIFDGSLELVTLTLLRTVPDRRYTVLLYPVFENVLTCTENVRKGADSIPGYVRMVFCFKRWKSLVIGRPDRAAIDVHACQLLPDRCPTVQHASDVPFLRLLPSVPPGQRATETRYLLVSDLFDLDRGIAQYFTLHRRTVDTPVKPPDDSSIRQRPRLQPMEIRSHYINVPLLAELIERKGQLWAFPAPLEGHPVPGLRQEALSIVESLRLIFRNRMDFIELTLLHVAVSPILAPLLAAVFEAFLRPNVGPFGTDRNPTATATGLTIYRSNDVETYGRLMLCYAKWKALYVRRNGPEPIEWAEIDSVALSQLPYDFPRAICHRDVLLRRIFPPVRGTGVDRTDGQRQNTKTRLLLRTLPERADLQELCAQFIRAYRCGSDATAPGRSQLREEDLPPMGNRAAYKSTSPTRHRALCWHLGDEAAVVSGQPTFRAHDTTEIGSEMKPIIILDSDGADEMSGCDTISMVTEGEDHNNHARPTVFGPVQPSTDVPCPLAVPGSNGSVPATQLDRNTPNTPIDESVTDDGTPPPTTGWPPLAECFLNTPPATPQQDVVPEVPDEEHRRSALVKRPVPSSSWLRLKGTIRTVGRRKKCISNAGAIKRALAKVCSGGSWWNFADILAVKVSNRAGGELCTSMMKELTGMAETVTNTATNDGLEFVTGQPAVVAGPRSSTNSDDHSENDALLRELIDCLGAVDTMPFDSTQGYVDFAILPDNPGSGAERSHSGTVDDQASPSVHESCVDTSPLFAADSDKYVVLFTELGPVSWPIV